MHVKMTEINKSFGTNKVLHDVEIEIAPGEVHGLMGENGAGKSTLMNILTGVHHKDTGMISIDGEEIVFNNPKEAENYGIAFIHQELNNLPDMTIEENLFLNREIKNSLGVINQKKMTEETEKMLKEIGLHFDPSTPMNRLSVGNQQLVEISKALMSDAKVIIMDEPTSALTDKEATVLFDIIRQLKANNVSVIYISHRMEEVFELTDRITVMRDGRYIDTLNTRETNQREIIHMMIGRELTERFPSRKTNIQEVKMEVQNLSDGYLLEDISFEVRAGEILGFSGLMGSGRSELMHCLFGDREISTGRFFMDGEEVTIANPKQAMQYGLALVSEDRKSEGLLLEKSVRENFTLANFDRVSKYKVISETVEEKMSTAAVKDFNIRTESIESLIEHLSGGNQQKAFIAKWVLTKPNILILDEPTRGVDIGSKEEIYKMMNELVEEGISIIMVSSDLPEIIGMSDRVAVMYEGKLQGIVDRSQATQENIMALATGGKILEFKK